VQEDWGWVRGRFETLNRMVTAGLAYIVDVTDLSAREDHLLELPWHIAGRGSVETRGRWVDDTLAEEFVTRVQRFVPDEGNGNSILVAHVHDGA
jgi:hypothetical protein